MPSHFSITASRHRITLFVYGILLLGMGGAVAAVGEPTMTDQWVACAVAAAIAAIACFAQDHQRDRVGYEAGIALALVALMCGGPLAALLVWLVPDVIHLVRRGRSFWGLGLLANVVSYLAAVLAGTIVLAGARVSGPAVAGVALAAGAAMSLSSYTFARLLFAWLRDGRSPGELLRTEFLPTLPVEACLLLLGSASSLLVTPLGPLALLPLASIVYVPKLIAGIVVRANSAARLDVDSAIDLYLDALSAELALAPGARRSVRSARALLADRPASPRRPIAAISCALEADICLRRPPVQPAYRPPLTVQALLVADAWARLTARCTRALNHEEALNEMWASDLSVDAPDALLAAGAIAARQQALTHHSSSLPRLHRLPLPRGVRTHLVRVCDLTWI